MNRIVVSAGAGVHDPKDEPRFVDKIFGFALGLLSKNVVEDMRRVVDKVRRSGMQWTVVRGPRLTDKPGQGQVSCRLSGW